MANPKKDTKKQGAEVASVDEIVEGIVNDSAAAEPTPKKKRLCRYPGCTKVIKSQGHCQRHGAKAKRCKVEGCDKQAQGTHEGMCKRHWKVRMKMHFLKSLSFFEDASLNTHFDMLFTNASLFDQNRLFTFQLLLPNPKSSLLRPKANLSMTA